MNEAQGLQQLAETEVDAALRDYGKEILVYLHKTVVVNVYEQAAKAFEEPVSCTGRCILNPTKEEVSVVGNLEGVDIAALFSRLEMVRRFGDAEEQAWLSELDEIEFENKRYRILQVHPTGRVENRCVMVVVLGANMLGEFRR